ncbi:family 16 glycosylhydrolase [Pseudochelatococcus sp. B33]
MAGELSGSGIIFSDEFNGSGPIDSAVWHYPVWSEHNNPSFLGRTQQRQFLPEQQDGSLRLRLDTYNPSDPNQIKTSLFGSEAITNRTFDIANGPVAIEARIRIDQHQPGIIGGFFTYNAPNPNHDEIDFEAITKTPASIQTNIYASEPLGQGSPISYPLPGGLQDFHTYRIEWLPGAVRWLVDGQEVRIETRKVPQNPQELHFNIWAPPPEWQDTGDASLRVAQNPGENQTFHMDVDYVRVENIAQSLGSNADDVLVGTAASEYIQAGAGNDRIVGLGGDDFIDGGEGIDTVAYAAAARNFAVLLTPDNDTVEVRDRTGGEGTDRLLNVELLEFGDRTVDLTWLLKAISLAPEDFVPLVDLYVAYLGRAPDSIGLSYWASELADSASVAEIARQFYHSAEAVQVRGDDWSAARQVDEAYAKILNREADAEGREFWVNEIESGRLSPELFALAFTLAARSHVDGSDAQAVADKAQIAAYYAIEHGLNDADAHAVLRAPDVHDGKALIDAYADSAASEDGALVTRLAGIDFEAHANAAAYGVTVWA